MEFPYVQQSMQQQLSPAVTISNDDDDERMDDDCRDGPADEMQSPPTSTNMLSYIRGSWYGSAAVPPPKQQHTRIVSMDCRQDDAPMEREGGDSEVYFHNSRIQEPLKRHQQARHEQQQQVQPPQMVMSHSDHDSMQGNKRRRLAPATFSATNMGMAFHNSIPSFGTERQHAVIEYLAPSGIAVMFAALGYTPFAIKWGTIMYILHFIQTVFTNFGPGTERLRWKSYAFIPPLPHFLMDSYLWNHSGIVAMLVWPDAFGPTAYWCAIFLIMGQQQPFTAVSLKTHYTRYRHLLTVAGNSSSTGSKNSTKEEQEKECYFRRLRQSIESRLLDCFVLYALAAILFAAADYLSSRLLFGVGMVELNVTPVYLVWSYRKRLDAALNYVQTNTEVMKESKNKLQ